MTMRPEGSERYRTDATFDALEELEGLAAERGASMAALALAWLLDVPEMTAVVVGPNTVEQLAPVPRRSSCASRRTRAPASEAVRDERARPLRRRTSATLLDMESCIEAMEEALAALARDELAMPLRFVFRPGGEQLLGLMPAHRGGTNPLFSLKEIVIAPANARRGLDPHQGAVLLHDGETGVLQAVLNASAITEIRTAAVSAVATKLLARPGARRIAILGAGVQARSHAHAMRDGGRRPRAPHLEPDPAHAEALALESHAVVCETVEEALDGADIVCTCTAAREPIVRRAWLAPGAHVNAVGSSVPSARELEAAVVAEASLFVDRRESTLNESGDYLRAVEEAGIGPDHIRAELGELLVGSHPGRSSDDELTRVQVARARRRGPRRGGALRRSAPASAGSAPRCRSDPARGDRARARDHRRRRRRDPARAARARRAVRDLAEARVPAADRLVQASRRVERDPPGGPDRVAGRRLDDERREHGAGRLLGRARARRPRDRRRARPRASREARRDRAARRPRRSRARSTPGGRRWRRAPTPASAGSSSIPSSTSA